MSQLPLVVLIATGGTIAMKLDPVSGAPVPAVSGEDLLASVPGLDRLARVRVENAFNIPSGYMDPPHWAKLHQGVSDALADPEVAGVVVSHGTDTLEETAWFLDLTVASEKPVVLVGAQRNASEWDSDGPRNLLNGVRTALCPEARGLGVLVAMNAQINAARDVIKGHTSDVEAFASGSWGQVGVVDEDRVVIARTPRRRQHLPLPQGDFPLVDIVPMYAGADGRMIRHAVNTGARGIVVSALGFGNVNEALHAAIGEAIAQGVAVVVATRVPRGRVQPVYGYVGGGKTLADLGCVFADDLPPHKARVLLMLGLAQGMGRAALQACFDR